MNYGSSKSAKIVPSKSIFNVKNRSNFFKKKLSKINLGDHLVKTFFLNSIFEPLYFLKLRPIFDKLALLPKYGSEEKGSSLCRCSSLLGFIMSKKQERLRSELLSEDKITNLLGFLT